MQDGWIDGWGDGWMDVWRDACTACKQASVHSSIHTSIKPIRMRGIQPNLNLPIFREPGPKIPDTGILIYIYVFCRAVATLCPPNYLYCHPGGKLCTWCTILPREPITGHYTYTAPCTHLLKTPGMALRSNHGVFEGDIARRSHVTFSPGQGHPYGKNYADEDGLRRI